MAGENFVKRKLASGRPVIGIWSLINSPVLAEVMGTAGLDFQILDLEHGFFDVGSLGAAIRACESTGCSPLVRVAGLQPDAIQRSLDLGAHGIVVPQVKGYQSALEAVQACHFAPLGTRGFNPFVRAGGYAGGAGGNLHNLYNGFGLTAIIVENTITYQELDQILGIAELDMVYLGVYDMSVALGHMGKISHPSVVEFVESSIPRIRQAGKAVGVMVQTAQEIRNALAKEVNVIVYGVDTFLVKGALAEVVTACATAPAR